MDKNSNIFIKAKQYVLGKMNDAERAAFESEMEKNPGLKEEVEFTRTLISGTEEKERRRLITLLSSETKETPSRKTDSPSPSDESIISKILQPKKLAFAASIALLLSAFIVFLVSRQDSLDKFATTEYVSPGFSGNLRDASNKSILSEAFLEFELGNYEGAIQLLDKSSTTDSSYILTLALMGHCHYQLGNFEEAIIALDKAIVLNNQQPSKASNYKDHIQWLRILSELQIYLTIKDKSSREDLNSKVLQFLESTPASNKYYSKAKKLQDLLKN